MEVETADDLLPAGRKALAAADQSLPPYGPALDLRCGSGIWAVKLAERGSGATDEHRAKAANPGVGVRSRSASPHVAASDG
jgi:hypothetical protein